MGNRITNRCHPTVSDLKMSNALSDRFFIALALSCSALAATPAQAAIARWLVGRDAAWFGLGGVGFDVGDLPWDPRFFPRQREFLLAATTDAMSGERWRVLLDLDDERRQAVIDALGGFRRLVEHLTQQDQPAEGHQDWEAEFSGEFETFEFHPAPRSRDASEMPYPWGYRCIVCNAV